MFWLTGSSSASAYPAISAQRSLYTMAPVSMFQSHAPTPVPAMTRLRRSSLSRSAFSARLLSARPAIHRRSSAAARSALWNSAGGTKWGLSQTSGPMTTWGWTRSTSSSTAGSNRRRSYWQMARQRLPGKNTLSRTSYSIRRSEPGNPRNAQVISPVTRRAA